VPVGPVPPQVAADAAALRGLVVASRKFQPDGGANFVTYAAFWVRATVARTVKRDLLDWEHRGRTPLVSGDAVFAVTPGAAPDPAALTHREWVRERVRAAVKKCVSCPHKRAVFRLRWGLDGGPELKLREVAALWGMSRERARQIDNEVRDRLWTHLRAVVTARHTEG